MQDLQHSFTALLAVKVSPVWSPYSVEDKGVRGYPKKGIKNSSQTETGRNAISTTLLITKMGFPSKSKSLSLLECYKTVFNLNGITFNEIFEYKHSKKTKANNKYTLNYLE